MKLLLDENLPHQLRNEVHGYQCVTVAYMGWKGIGNGELLQRAASEGFDALLTKDAGLPYERNLTDLPVSVVVIRAASNDIDDIRPIIPALLKVLNTLQPRQLVHVP